MPVPTPLLNLSKLISVMSYFSLSLAYCITSYELWGFALSKIILSLIEGYHEGAEVIFEHLFVTLSRV